MRACVGILIDFFMTIFYYTNDIFTCENFRLPAAAAGGWLAVQGDESGSVTNIEQFHSEFKQTFNMEF